MSPLLIKCISHILSHIETNRSIFSWICSKVQQLGAHLVQRYVFLCFFELPSYDNPCLEAVLSGNNAWVSFVCHNWYVCKVSSFNATFQIKFSLFRNRTSHIYIIICIATPIGMRRRVNWKQVMPASFAGVERRRMTLHFMDSFIYFHSCKVDPHWYGAQTSNP